MTAFFHLCAAWTLAPIDRVAATTTVRLWHDLHSSALQAHDFAHLLAPAPPAMTFFAAIQHDEMLPLFTLAGLPMPVVCSAQEASTAQGASIARAQMRACVRDQVK